MSFSVCSIYSENLINTPNAPSKKNYIYDRFIPNREAMKDECGFQAYGASFPSNAYQASLYQVLFERRNPFQPTLPLSKRKICKNTFTASPLKKIFNGFCSRSLVRPCVLKDNMLTVGTENCIYVVDIKESTGAGYPVKDDEVICAFSWDLYHTKLAIAYDDNGLCVWDKNTEKLSSYQKPTGEVFTSQIEWKEPCLIAMGYDREFSLMDIREKRISLTHCNFDNRISYTGFNFSKDGQKVYFTTTMGSIEKIDLRKEVQKVDSTKIAEQEIIHFERIDPNSERVITAALDGVVRIFDIQNDQFKPVKTINTKRQITSLALTEKHIVVSDTAGSVVTYQSKNYSLVGEKHIPNLHFLFADSSNKQWGTLQKVTH